MKTELLNETRASFTNPLGNTTIKIVVQYPATVAAACNILYVDDVELIKEESLDHFTPGGSGSPTYGWTGSNTLTSPAVVSNALRITNNTAQEGFKRNITLAAKKYTFSFFMDKGLEDLNEKEYFSVDIINSSNAIVYTYTTKVNATGYYNFDYSATTAGTYTWRFRRVSLNGRSSSGTAYFDDFKVSSTIQQSQQVCSSPKNYRFGFNTQEKDDEVYGAGNLNTAEFWEYDTRIGRRWNVDPIEIVGQSLYSTLRNNPINWNDIEGNIPIPLYKKFKIWGWRIDSWFGPRNTGLDGASTYHKGLDFNYEGGGNTDKGALILATHEGIATIKESIDGGTGRMIIITSPDGKFRTRYLHLSKINIKEGEYISEAMEIGEMGGSANGSETGRTVHLHYEFQMFNQKTGLYENIDPTNGLGKSADNILDPQKLITPIRKNIKNVVISRPRPKKDTGFWDKVKNWVSGLFSKKGNSSKTRYVSPRHVNI